MRNVLVLFCACACLSLVGCGSACAGSASGSWSSAFFCGGGAGGGGGGRPAQEGDPRSLLLVEGAMIEGELPDVAPFAVAAAGDSTVDGNRSFYEPYPDAHGDPVVSLTAELADRTMYFDLEVRGTSFGELPEGSYGLDDPSYYALRVWFGTRRTGAESRVGGDAWNVRMEIDGPPGGRRTVSVWADVWFQEAPIHAVFDITEIE